MANNNPVVPPELASILATLAQFAPPPVAPPNTQEYSQEPYRSTTPPGIPENHAAQAYQQPYASYSTTAPSDPRVRPTPQGRSTPIPQGRSTPTTEKLIIDPATITDWSAGLRCVSKVAAQNRLFGETIRRMITDQRKHEMQWYSSRQTLKQTQAKRGAGASEIQSILKSVTGSNAFPQIPITAPQTEEEKAAELVFYDLKVYRAQRAMQDALGAELKSLGVPFFGTNADRILPDDSDDVDVGSQPKWSPRVTKLELLGLQRKMIAYLEDMYKE